MSVRPRVWTACAIALWLAALGAPSAASAQALPDDPFPHDDGDDPIGLDDDSRTLDALASQRMKPAAAKPIDTAFGPQPPMTPSVRSGEIVTAIPAARESAHRVRVQLAPALAQVTVEIELTSTANKPCEVRYRLAVPKGGRLASLEVCTASGCRRGIEDDSEPGRSAYDAAVLSRTAAHGAHAARGPLPVAHARLSDDGKAIVVRAAPVVLDKPLKLTLRYEADAPMHGGTVRFALPPRGMDPRAAQTEVELSAPGLLDARVAGQLAGADALLAEPWVELPITASAPGAAPAKTVQRNVGCDDAQCVHARAWAGPRALTRRNIVIALDVSPSTEGPARGRLLAALAAILEAAPAESRVRALAFAARASAIVEAPSEPSAVALAPFGAQIQGAELGAATRFEAVWEIAGPWLQKKTPETRGLRPLIVVLGDGGLTIGGSDAFARARRAGVEVAAVNVADRSAVSALRERVFSTGGVVIEAGATASVAANGRDTAQLVEQTRALFAPTLTRVRVGPGIDLGPLRAGEALAYFAQRGNGPRAQRDALYSSRTALTAVDPREASSEARAHDWPAQPLRKGVCDRRGPATRKSGLSSDAAPLALAEERPCAFAVVKEQVKAAELGEGMPADPLLDMLRLRVLPLARGCFRRDRAGRGQYTRRALFAFELADREVVSAHVEGSISESLRACLLGAVDTLDVPRFTGTVRVTYPLVTESAPVAEQIELTPLTAGSVDALLGAKKAARPLP